MNRYERINEALSLMDLGEIICWRPSMELIFTILT